MTSPPAPLSPSRGQALALLVASFLGLSVVTYSDYPREPAEMLNEQERNGLEVWRKNNCQACHQIHGFGGFHGPDLTNRLTDEVMDAELIQVILLGQGRMPAFEMSDEELEDLMAWLRMMNYSGVAIPAPLEEGKPPIPLLHLKELLTLAGERGLELPEGGVRDGMEIWTSMNCGSCHRPFQTGRLREPDLAAAATDRSFENLRDILTTGRGRMPSVPLDDDQVRALGEFLEWVAEERTTLSKLNIEFTEHATFSWGDVPWFEYQ